MTTWSLLQCGLANFIEGLHRPSTAAVGMGSTTANTDRSSFSRVRRGNNASIRVQQRPDPQDRRRQIFGPEGGNVWSFAKSDQDSDVSKIAAIRESWIAAVKCGDIDGLVSLASDDIVVVYGNGKCVCGKDELRKSLEHYLDIFDVEQWDSSGEVTFHNKWALLFSK